jgi:hypothetical protein
MTRPHAPLSHRRRAALTALCAVLIALCAVAASPGQADAFCGFYISGAEGSLFNNATQVVLMRDGKRTVLSMQNHYDGPPEDFAMVVPVPVVLKEEDVKTLPHSVFQTVDTMASPRLVEYWEQDPCPVMYNYEDSDKMMMAPSMAGASRMESESAAAPVVTIEAQFEVGEYEVVILSANDSMALDTWLRAENYKIPPGAEPALRPYIESGMFFFVAKVNLKKVQREDGRAVLSPLRFHYDTDTFQLPVRLGLLNADGAQDLIIHVLARGQRYEVANYENVTIPTNIEVKAEARSGFGEFYAALFDATVAKHPKAVVTEYAWDAASCDPCPGPTIDPSQISLLGADVLANQDPWGFVLTRMHARYTAADLKDDLVFQAAPPIVGGREFLISDGVIEKGSRTDSINNFQGRYIIRNPWQGPITCSNPVRGVWGGPPGGGYESPPVSAKNTAFAPRGAELASYIAQDIDELGVEPSDPPVIPPTAYLASAPSNIHANCGRCAVRSTPLSGGSSPLQALSALLFGFIAWRIGRRRP